ncbi:type VI secretion system membrane subunit TssM [Nitrosomonas communis]|uniref:Type VI secretion system protein ImpL n=1 Tax=Nitrosomonas communis TaxID=44574 RepID=A0A1H2Z8E4_9PROT|nr:type VI secretion system membrane subunit TssM [Nitrosomonas communis]SDX13596.1 type VI secretion system protein ImpL [Nitrosomonas communis]
MKKVFKFLFNRWTFRILGLVALSALIWFAGPLIALAEYRPLETNTARSICIVLIIGFYIGKLAWGYIKTKNLNTKLMDALLRQVSPPPIPGSNAGAEAVALMNKRFEEAITILKKANLKSNSLTSLLARLNRQYVYELPWYIFIGAPGSGKTTALVNSGLQFPLAERLGGEEIRGVGGTRNCDWFFTNEAVLLDTAGRFVTQESHHEVDSAEWLGFLQLLKKYRPRRPINGVIITISVADLLQLTPAQREWQANEIRKRIQELYTELNCRFPLYVLVTKVDLLAGFMEFFSEYGKEERAQVWGTTFPVPVKPDNSPLPNFKTELSVLEQRLNDRLVDYLQKERDLQRRTALYSFPQQFSHLKEKLSDFLSQVFLPSRFEQPPLLRGVYFTSGTQEGNPIDRIMGNLARALQLERKLFLPNKPTGKSFFLTKLIKDVIFPEAELAGTNLRWERQQSQLQWLAFTIVILITVSMITIWTVSYSHNKSYIAEVDAKASALSTQVTQLEVGQNTNIESLLSILRSVQELAETSDINSDSPPLSMDFGLYQGDKLAAASNSTYKRLLQDAFLPQLVLRIEHLMSNYANTKNMELLYEGLKAYIMLYQADHLEPEALKSFILVGWETSLSQELSNEERKALKTHLDNLLDLGKLSPPIAPNTQLITEVRDFIANQPIEQRIYNRLKQLGVGEDIPEFTISNAVGPAASLVFTRASGKPLTRGVPGLFSYKGYHKSFLQAAKEATRQLAQEESWVLDISKSSGNVYSSLETEASINDKVLRLYLNDYAKTWEIFINDIRLIRTNTLRESIELARLLSAYDSPLPVLLRAIVKEVTLINIDENDKSIVDKATDNLKSARETLKQLLGGKEEKASTVEIVSRPEYIVDNHTDFRALREIVQPVTPGQPAKINEILIQINELYIQLTAVEEALKEGIAPPASKIHLEIGTTARRLPEPLRTMFTTLSTTGVGQTQTITIENLNQSLNNTITEFCHKATSGRYPFTKGSTKDVTQDDFSQLFASGGRFDDFFQKELSQHVDTTTRPWRFRKISNDRNDLVSEGLNEFYRAKIIRDVFFPEGGRSTSISITFKPIDMDATLTQFILNVDGQLVKYGHGPQVPVKIQWPGPGGSSQVRVQFSPIIQAGKSGQVFNGPWALFRMFDTVQIIPSPQPEKFIAVFDIDGRKAQFEVVTSSVQNPFRLQALEKFKCPSRL